MFLSTDGGEYGYFVYRLGRHLPLAPAGLALASSGIPAWSYSGSRSCCLATLGCPLATVYAGLVLLATRVLSFHIPVAVAASTLAAAALFSPLRRRTKQAVDRERQPAQQPVRAARLGRKRPWLVRDRRYQPVWPAVGGHAADRDSYLGRRIGNINPWITRCSTSIPGGSSPKSPASAPASRRRRVVACSRPTPGCDMTTGVGTPKIAALITAPV
jgi:hypothetical protein